MSRESNIDCDSRELRSNQGISPSTKMMDELLTARPGTHSRTTSYGDSNSSERGINFTMFLTMMSERLFEFDTEAELLEAVGSFDENDSGTVKVEEMRKWLGEIGERMSEQEVCVSARIVDIFLKHTHNRSTGCSKDRLQTDKGTLTIANG